MLTEECHISGDLNINLYKNGSTLEEENKNIIKGANKISSETKNIQDFVKLLAVNKQQNHQLVSHPTSTLINHILANKNEKITQSGLINIGLSDHQMSFCTRNIKKEKTGGHKQVSTVQ